MLADGLELVADLARSHGVYLYDARRERELLDFFGNFSTTPLGYNHPHLRRPEVEQALLTAAVNKPSNSDLYTTELAAFVETFARIVPRALSSHLFFIAGGALAVENALKAAFDWKVRKNLAAGRGEKGSLVVHFREAFHGRSGYTLSLTNTDPAKTLYFPKFDWPRIVNPKLGFPVTDEVVEAVRRQEEIAISQIKDALVRHPHEIAALVIEPIQGEGGDNHFRGEFFEALRELADAEDFMLVFDEVQTGFGTTGRWWCCEHFDVVPDILAFGKKSQICGIAASRRLDEVESVFATPSRINSTWGGNLVDMIRCRAIIEAIEEEGLLERATSTGVVLLEGLERLQEVFPETVTGARGRGLFLAFDLPDKEARNRALLALREHQLLALPCGPRSIRFRPSLILEAEEAREGLRRVERTLADLEAA
jgi:L-lysine 6-transaminase